MRLHLVLALTASLGLATADCVARPVATGPQCEVHGTRSSLAFVISTSLVDNTFSGCQALCTSTSGCKSFSFQLITGGECSLYNSVVGPDFSADASSPEIFFDLVCPAPVVSGAPLISYTPTSTIPSITQQTSVVTFPAYTTPAILSTDSPPYTPTGPQVTPTDDDQFTATYTYTEFPLTVNATGYPPITAGVPQPSGTALPSIPCMVSPGPQAPFSVLNDNFIPMVSRTSNSVGPLLQPTAAPAAGDPMLDPATFTLPGFYLQAPAGVTGVYDMVYAGETTQFVAMTENGEVVLVGASTGTAFVSNSVTSIFNVDCYGIISITLGGVEYTWSTDGESSTISQTSTPANNLKALPFTVPGVPIAPKDRKRAQEQAADLVKRQAGFSAPSCPNTPAGLKSETKQGYKLDQGNFCDALADDWSISPFDFTGSCIVQSLCYDQCQDFSWEGCNAIFGEVMLASCAAVFDNWWDVLQAIACAAQAAWFTGQAATDKGRQLYYTAQDNMCGCFCTSPPDTCFIPDKGVYYCADIHGNDEDNCGNCGRQCGANSACHGGVCGCPLDQCGQTCLDFRNNPNNCGTCGNVCNPAYCIGGECYAPKPDECSPDEGVTNNDFSDYSPTWANWTVGAYPGCTLGDEIIFSAALYTPQTGAAVMAISVEMTDLPAAGCHAALSQAQVKMCPGFEYDLTFAMGYVNQVGGSSVISNADCTVRWLTGTPDLWNDNDNFQSSPSYPIGTSNPDYKTFGPWSITVAAGDPGVTQVKANLFVDLTAVLACNTPTGATGRFVITDVELKATGLATRSLTIGEEKAGLSLQERESADANTSVVLAPYYPAQKEGSLLLTGFKSNHTLKARSQLGWA